MENEDHSDPILTNVLFSGNSAYHEGGGMFNTVGSNPTLMNVAFINNAVTDGGGGGMQNSNSSPILTNVTFSGNHAVVGGGIGNWQSWHNAGVGAAGFALNDAALAGLEPKPGGPPHYYAADDAATLEAALTTIAGGIIIPSCSFELVSLPPVPSDVAVYFDGVAVPRNPNHGDGWDYYPDAGTITFFGSYCTTLESGQVTDVSFIFGCPGPVVN